MKTYSIFLFDADGTLFDYDRAEENALRIMFENYGFSGSNNLRSMYREINSQVWADHEQGKITKDELQVLRFSRLFNRIGVHCDPEEFNAEYLNQLGRGTFLIDGAPEICREITSSGKKIYIVTNGILAVQKARITYSEIGKYISEFFVSEFVGYSKPHPLYFEYVFTHIQNPDREKTLIIGDSLTADIAGGNSAGIDSCWFNMAGAVNTTGIKPAFTISRLSELGGYINRDPD